MKQRTVASTVLSSTASLSTASRRFHFSSYLPLIALLGINLVHGQATQNPDGDFSCDGDAMWVRTTAYCHMEGDHITFGNKLRFGNVRSAAADWSRFPVGTRFKIEGQPHEYYVDDYGIALTDSWTIDLYFPTMGMMHRWGTRRVKIQVIEWGSFEKSLKILKGRAKRGSYIRRMIASIENDSGFVEEPEKKDEKVPDAKAIAANKEAIKEKEEVPTEDT